MKNEAPRNAARAHDVKAKPSPTEYLSTFGRVPVAQCSHPLFLDYVFPHTGICLDCGAEHMCCMDWRTLSPGDVVTDPGLPGMRYVAEGRTLSDAELVAQRHVFHGIWGLAGWTHTDPTYPTPPAHLTAQLNGKSPDRVSPPAR